MQLVSVQTGRPKQLVDADGARWTTAFGKAPVQGAVKLRTLGLEGDGVADKRYHGGVDMAVLAYSADHYPEWRTLLSRPELPLGGFGENLSVLGATEESVYLGDVWSIGGARLQVASPRKPCSAISRFSGIPDLLKRVEKSGRIGWYLRVLEEGPLEAGQEVRLVERPHPDWSVARAMRVGRARKKDPAAARALIECAALSERWKAWLRDEARV